MKLIVGLGNPGKKYEQTWHNLGFAVLDELQKTWAAEPFATKKKYQADVSQADHHGEKIFLVKPQTFMNNSGQAVRLLLNFYQLEPTDLFVIHDDIDIPLGQIKISVNASSAGNRGVQSIIDSLGSKAFTRFRVGIRPTKPSRVPTEDYVLQKIPLLSKVKMGSVTKATAKAVTVALEHGTAQAMNQFN